MTEVERMLGQLDRAFKGEAWHGPALLELLDDISFEQASRHPIRDAHSIWEIVNHIASWNSIVQHRLAGQKVDVTSEVDWPPVWESSDVAWTRSIEHFRDCHARLRKAIAAINEADLETTPPGQKDSRYVMVHGVIQHDLYHAGQIAILKKALRGRTV